MLSRCLLPKIRCRSASTLFLSRCNYSQNASPNHDIIEMLKSNREEEDKKAIRNAYKVRAFDAAIRAIASLDQPVRTVAEVKQLKGVGPGISKRIGVFLHGTQYCEPPKHVISPAKLEEEALKQELKVLQTVPGVGERTAKQLFDAGCTTVADMSKPEYFSILSSAQQIGLRFAAHLSQPVTCDEAETVANFVRENIPSRFEVHLAGSYRRGVAAFSDIDILLFHPSHVHVPTPPPLTEAELAKGRRGRKNIAFREGYAKVKDTESSMLCNHVVKPLKKRGLINVAMVSGAQRWHGIIRIPERTAKGLWEEKELRVRLCKNNEGNYRRLSLNLVPMKSRGAALLALTGDMEFTKTMSAKAASLGMHLNEFGLWRWQPDDTASTPNEHHDDEEENQNGILKGYWMFVEGESEAAIMGELGMEYVEPEKRNFSYLLEKPSRGRGRPRRTVV